MTDDPHLSMRKLEPFEVELALALADSLADGDPEGRSESFGLARVRAIAHGEVRGLWIKGGLAGAMWLKQPDAAGVTEVAALALAGGWRKLNLVTWMLGEAAAAGGRRPLVADVDGGGTGLGAAFADAGFVGPDQLDETYPAGKWSRP